MGVAIDRKKRRFFTCNAIFSSIKFRNFIFDLSKIGGVFYDKEALSEITAKLLPKGDGFCESWFSIKTKISNTTKDKVDAYVTIQRIDSEKASS